MRNKKQDRERKEKAIRYIDSQIAQLNDGYLIEYLIKTKKEMQKDFVSQCNNPEKLFPTAHLDIKEYVYNERHILYIYVYESSDVHKTGNKIYDRNVEGDFDITNNTTLISNLYIHKKK